MYACLVVIRKSFRYRIYPTLAQITRLLAWEHALRFLWNLALEQRLMAYGRSRSDRKYPTAIDQINELTELRAMLPWLADVPRNVCAQFLIELDRAWQKCFMGICEQPRWKHKERTAIGLSEPHPKVFRIDGANLLFPKIGSIPMVLHRPFEGTPKIVTIVRDIDQWFASVWCEIEITEPVQRDGVIAIDRGVVNLTADSNGHIEPNPGFLKRQSKKENRSLRSSVS
jgi:putative transposase